MDNSTQAISLYIYMNFGHVRCYKIRIIDNFMIFHPFEPPLAGASVIFTPLWGKIEN